MSEFPPHVTDALLEDARETTVKRGEIFYRAAQHSETAMLALIGDGLMRTFIEAYNGRRVTIRYAGPGDLVGEPALVAALARAEQPSRGASTDATNYVVRPCRTR